MRSEVMGNSLQVVGHLIHYNIMSIYSLNFENKPESAFGNFLMCFYTQYPSVGGGGAHAAMQAVTRQYSLGELITGTLKAFNSASLK